jgi:DNA mismatch repair protein MutS
MAGKSTFMRQVALITVLAQIGSFVPANEAHIGVCDRVFTRVGASDDLFAGRSTFMVEMNEVAEILKYATNRSLLILDEIGRGTSTFDGMSIARAVLEYVADKKYLGAKTLFATHYHELCALEGIVDGVKNYNIVVKKRGEDIIFIKKIVPGGANDSYGIEVAKLAGLPDKVVKRARAVLAEIERKPSVLPVSAAVPEAAVEEPEELQLSLGSMAGSELVERLRKLEPEVLTPIEAMNLLYELHKQAQDC